MRNAVPRFNTCDQAAPAWTISSQQTEGSLMGTLLVLDSGKGKAAYLSVGGRTAANIHPSQAEEDIVRYMSPDVNARSGGKHEHSMPEEFLPSARIIFMV